MDASTENTREPKHEKLDSEGDFCIVGVGASAGGLEALEKMFQGMPKDLGMAFVIVQHLSPDFKSLMDELLARHTRMPIHRVEDGMVVRPNSLYLIPPKQDMIISDGKLLLTEKDSSQSLSLPIDHFFRSLAQDAGKRSVAVVLSGTGSDGSRGIRDVSEAGGLVIVQAVESARFDGMPRSAIDTGVVDVVVEPGKIPEVLNRFAEDPFRSQFDPSQDQPVDETSIEGIFRLLQQRHKIDFNYYKPTTIGRRIERRIQLNHHGDIDEYVWRLEDDPAEVDRLYKDLLIGVTRFFRDRDAFDALRNDVLPQLLTKQKTNEEFRVWVACCATGEEAYSIAIMIDECMRAMNRRLSVKIFATDVHQSSLDFAHAGVYPEASLQEMTAARRDQYFIKTDAGYQVSPDIREMIVFAPHNLVKDAPFTRMHLITCRNMLIYLRAMAQKKVLSLFHFGLKAGGLLFLGASESPGELSEEFETLNERWKIYRKCRDVRLVADFRSAFGYHAPAYHEPQAVVPIRNPVAKDRDLLATYDALLEQYMPAAILVDDQGQVAQNFGGAGKFLRLTDGRVTANVLDLVEGDLKLALTGALQRVAKTEKTVICDRVRISSDTGEQHVRVEVAGVKKPADRTRFLITFEELDDSPGRRDETSEAIDLGEVSRNRVQDLEQELRYSKENLQAAIEELETSNEELQATNEELVASNEELQSTNEELHSVNEELYTVNAEYQKKISELTELTNDMDNLFVSTEVHTLFLDGNLCIRKFTPKMAEVFNLLPHDLGRRIDAFAHNIVCDDLTAKVWQVLDSGEQCEERVKDNQQHHFLMRVLPYRVGALTNGVVLTLIEISSLVSAQEDVLHEREKFERVIAANRDGVWDWPDVNQDEMWWSAACYELLGYEPDEFPARHSEWLRLIQVEDRQRVMQTSVPNQDKCFVELHRDFEYRMLHKSGEYRWFRHRAMVDHDDSGAPVRITGSICDIHDRKCAEMQNAEEIRRRDNFLAMLSHELRNPMGAVLNAIECLKAAGETGSTQESSAADQKRRDSWQTEILDEEAPRIIERQTRHMARLLDDLLDVARYGQSKIEFRKQRVDLSALADDVLETVNYEIEAKNQILHVTIGDGPLCVFADPARIKQAQVNLLNNASKYSPPAEDIWYEVDREGDEAVITVRDEGEGIPENLLDSIFDLFVQSETSLARSSGGMGVGLSLARTIVEAHDGTIQADSEGPGKGSAFRIRLPLTDPAFRPQPPAPHFAVDGCKLLLVEDNDDARKMLARTLRLKGIVVQDAADGRAALELFRSFRPDVAVIDIGLPGMDGYQLARAVREAGELADTLLIALTGYARQADRQAAINAGFDAHLVKPLNPAELYAQISNATKTSSQETT